MRNSTDNRHLTGWNPQNYTPLKALGIAYIVVKSFQTEGGGVMPTAATSGKRSKNAMAKTNNGKSAERAVQNVLEALKQSEPKFDYQRLYDATSARGAFQAQVSDFLFFMPNVHGAIEVKSTEHFYRIKKQAFTTSQMSRLKRRMDAGGEAWVIVHHHIPDLWRAVPFSDCYEAFTGGKASMDMTERYLTFATAAESVEFMLKKILNKGNV